MYDQLKSLAVFSKVAEIGTFSGAAKALSITAPVVSQHISQLEKDLDVALIYRSTRSLRLTDAGEKLSLSARKMLDVAESGIDSIIGEDSIPHGKLSISTPGIADYEPFLDGLTKYIKLFPNVELSVSFDDHVVDLIRDGFDMAIRKSDVMSDSTLISRKLIESQIVLTCSPEYMNEKGIVDHPSELSKFGYKWIGMISNHKTVLLRRKSNPEEKIEIPVDPAICVNSYAASYNLAVRSNGLTSISMLDHSESLKKRILVEPLPDWEMEPAAFYAVWPANAGSRSLIRHFLNFVLTEIAKGAIGSKSK